MYDVIVIGTGGVGSAALCELAGRGLRVLGLDRFPPGHQRGSSHGQTRIIRRSYFEHPDYVPLLNMAWDLWDELCARRDTALLQRTGLVYFGPPQSPVITGVIESAAQHHLKVDVLEHKESAVQFPAFVVPDEATVLFESEAGYLFVEECVTAFIDDAIQQKAEIKSDATVLSWSSHGSHVSVDTDGGRYEAARLVVTAGAWSRSLLAELDIPLQVVRKHLHWYTTRDRHCQQARGCPCFFYAAMNGYFYGFPDFGHGLKVAEHSGGQPIDDPLRDDHHEESADTERIGSFLQQYLPGVDQQRLRHDVCFYTMTPDEHFIIDRHPEHPNVVFAAGLSGHGFKFASAIGRMLTELAVDGRTSVPLDFLSLQRAGLLR
ncbi:MAG: N-methyl-L-tryptophan oxidase [Fuerstiella sp.]